MNDLDWPPPFTIRISARCRRLILRISSKGLELVTPKKITQQKAMSFLTLKKNWITQNWHLACSSRLDQALPNLIELEAVKETWQVSYAINQVARLNYDLKTREIKIYSEYHKDSLYLLRKWFCHKATTFLIPMLERWSKQYRLPYGKVSVRFQKTRWGSCSRAKNINLNAKLLFLPINIVDYVIVHELVHTIHFDHSPLFWATVQNYLSDYQERRAALKKLETQIPNWLY